MGHETAMDVWADRSDLRENLPHPDRLWTWSECPLGLRIQQKLHRLGHIERVGETEYWRTTRKLWEYVRSKYGVDAGMREVGQAVLVDDIDEGRDYDDKYLVNTRERRRETRSQEVTLSGNVVETHHRMAAYERNKQKNPNKNPDPADAPGQTCVTDYIPVTTPDGWDVVVRYGGHRFGVPTSDVY